MKNKLTILLSLCTILVFFTSVNVYAHELYYSKNGSTITEVQLRWINKNTSTGRLKVLIDKQFLKDSWANYYENARVAWHSSAAPAEFLDNTTSPNTFMATASAQYWKNRFPGDSSWNEILGVTDLFNVSNTLIDSYTTASTMNKQIKGANIYLKPNPYNNAAHIYRAIMVHELGHVLCLGHSHDPNYKPADPATDPSIMNYNYMVSGPSYLPQAHEIKDVKSMYGY